MSELVVSAQPFVLHGLIAFSGSPRCTHAALRGRDPYLYGIDDSQHTLRRDKEAAEEVGKEA